MLCPHLVMWSIVEQKRRRLNAVFMRSMICCITLHCITPNQNAEVEQKRRRLNAVFMRSMIAQQRSLKGPEAVGLAADIIVSDSSHIRLQGGHYCPVVYP